MAYPADSAPKAGAVRMRPSYSAPRALESALCVRRGRAEKCLSPPRLAEEIDGEVEEDGHANHRNRRHVLLVLRGAANAAVGRVALQHGCAAALRDARRTRAHRVAFQVLRRASPH